MGALDFYHKEYKKLLIIPILLLILAITQIGYQTATTGDFINKGRLLKGGLSLSIIDDTTTDVQSLQSFLKQKFPDADIDSRTTSKLGVRSGLIIDAADIEKKDLEDAILGFIPDLTEDDIRTDEMGSSLGESFFKQTLIAIIIAFIFMAIVVFYYFRTLAPSLAVIMAALSDIIITVAIVNVLGIKISTAGIAAFLMLIGYSVDTDILLSTRVLKRKEGTVFSRIEDAMGTGLTMTITTIVAVGVALIFAKSDVIIQIMTIIFIGLLVDIINTWIQNVGILRLYLDRKK